MLYGDLEATSCISDLEVFENRDYEIKGEIMRFEGAGDCFVYNPSIPFISGGRTVIAARVDDRKTHRSESIFFNESADGIWRIIEGAPSYRLEDPFVTRIDDEIIFGGVEVDWKNDRAAAWRTVFYRGESIETLKLFARGPKNMKDIRLCGLPDGRVVVFSRPRISMMKRKYDCLAHIGFAVLPSLDDLTPEAIESAGILEGHFIPDEWGGVNQAYVLPNGLIGIIGHKAYGEEINDEYYLHYYGISFAIDPDTRRMTAMKIIIRRSNFPGNGKEENHPRLADVTFTAGIVRRNGGKALLYTGLSDSRTGCAEIPDPFIEYEMI